MSGSAKINCNCSHQYQDTTYGTGVRIATKTQKEPTQSSVEVRCTVCSKVHVVSKDKVK